MFVALIFSHSAIGTAPQPANRCTSTHTNTKTHVLYGMFVVGIYLTAFELIILHLYIRTYVQILQFKGC